MGFFFSIRERRKNKIHEIRQIMSKNKMDQDEILSKGRQRRKVKDCLGEHLPPGLRMGKSKVGS